MFSSTGKLKSLVPYMGQGSQEWFSPEVHLTRRSGKGGLRRANTSLTPQKGARSEVSHRSELPLAYYGIFVDLYHCSDVRL